MEGRCWTENGNRHKTVAFTRDILKVAGDRIAGTKGVTGRAKSAEIGNTEKELRYAHGRRGRCMALT
jgi:hypothetical protein